MQDSSPQSTIINPPKPKRPFGVAFITIFLGLFAGVFPIAVSISLFFSQPEFFEVSIGLVNFIFILLLGLFIIVTAIGTWRGNNKARFLFLIAITLHYSLIAYQAYQVGGLEDASLDARNLGRGVRGIFWIIICWWYFTSVKVKSFF